MITKERLLYEGKPLEQLSREELLEAVRVIHQFYLNERELFREMAELCDKKYKPETWLGRLLNLEAFGGK